MPTPILKTLTLRTLSCVKCDCFTTGVTIISGWHGHWSDPHCCVIAALRASWIPAPASRWLAARGRSRHLRCGQHAPPRHVGRGVARPTRRLRGHAGVRISGTSTTSRATPTLAMAIASALTFFTIVDWRNGVKLEPSAPPARPVISGGPVRPASPRRGGWRRAASARRLTEEPLSGVAG